jgi:hypothetical protein
LVIFYFKNAILEGPAFLLSFLTIIVVFNDSSRGVGRMIPDIIHEIYEDTITYKAKAAWQREVDPTQRTNHLGYLFFAVDKESFAKGTSLRTYYTLDQKMSAAIERLDQANYEAPFITFNSFSIRKKERKYLRWLNAVSIEIDNPEAELSDIFYFCQIFDISYPSLILKSPKGFHLHWLIEREKATIVKLKDYDRVSQALKKAFSWIKADAIGPERYWRMPTAYNIKYQIDDRYTLAELAEWANGILEVTNNISLVKEIEGGIVGTTAPKLVLSGVMENPAIQRLLRGVPYGLDIRNRTAFTLALLLFRAQNMDPEDVYTYLSDEWNPKNEVPIKENELRKTVRSACSGKYKTAKTQHINEILEVIGSDLRFQYQIHKVYIGKTTYTKRVDLIDQILTHVKDQGGKLQISQRSLALSLGAAFKSVQNALVEIKEKELAIIETSEGRGGGTVISLPTEADSSEDIVNNTCSQEGNIVPLPSEDPIKHTRNAVAAYGYSGATLVDILKFTQRDRNMVLGALQTLVDEGELVEITELEMISEEEIELIQRYRIRYRRISRNDAGSG